VTWQSLCSWQQGTALSSQSLRGLMAGMAASQVGTAGGQGGGWGSRGCQQVLGQQQLPGLPKLSFWRSPTGCVWRFDTNQTNLLYSMSALQ
jgi:hypothetical protein